LKILLIGGAGYVGAPLAYRLWRDGHEVTVLDALLHGAESLVPLVGEERFILRAADLRSEDALEPVMAGHDAVVLLAAIVGEAACNRDPELATTTNLVGTKTVLAAAERAGIHKFVFISTCSNYGISDNGEAVTERVLAGIRDGFVRTVLRLATAFGVSPRMRFDLLIPDFTRAAICEGRITIYGEQFWRPHVHVADIADAITRTLLADSEAVSGEIFNVGSNANNAQKLTIGKAVQSIVGNTDLEFEKRTEDPRSYQVDFEKINKNLGFQANWSIEAGIEEVARAIRDGFYPNPYDPRYTN